MTLHMREGQSKSIISHLNGISLKFDNMSHTSLMKMQMPQLMWGQPGDI
jgi:hypothetical protein